MSPIWLAVGIVVAVAGGIVYACLISAAHAARVEESKAYRDWLELRHAQNDKVRP